MRWPKGDLRKSDVIIIGVMLLLTLLIVVLYLLGWGHQTAPSRQATGTAVLQATPTVDATAVVQDQLKQQDEKLQRDNSFPWTILNAVGSSIGTILVAAAALIAAWLGWRQWLTNRKDEQKKRAEERFQKVVEGLSSERKEAKVGAAIMLRTFLQPGYEQFYRQTFDLAVTHLRLPHDDPNISAPLDPDDPDDYVSLDPLSQALITVFKESFQLARKPLIGQEKPHYKKLEALDASHIKLDNAFLRYADLEGIWMRDAFLSNASLRKVNLSNAYLTKTNFSDASLRYANLSGARLRVANLSHAHLDGADLHGAYLGSADLDRADLHEADLRGADLHDADLDGTKLQGAKYNTKKIQEKDGQGNLVTIKPTQWPQKFNPSDTKWGLICVDC